MNYERSHFIEESKGLEPLHLTLEPALTLMAIPVPFPLEKMDGVVVTKQIDLFLPNKVDPKLFNTFSKNTIKKNTTQNGDMNSKWG